MIPYKIIIPSKPEVQLKKLSNEFQKRILNKLIITQEDPFCYFIRLKGRQDYKLRIGDYRVIADINQMERTIEITKIGHRKKVYN